MAIGNTSALFTSASSEALRAAYAAQLRSADEAALGLFQAQAGGGIPPGTTLTARTQYKVQSDGSLLPLETSITAESDAVGSATDSPNGQKNARNFQNFEEGAPRSLADILPPKAQLSPSEETTLFAVSVAPAALQPQQAALGSASVLAEEDGQPIEAELILPGEESTTNRTGATSLADQAHAQASGLYARNNDIIYNVEPVAAIAA